MNLYSLKDISKFADLKKIKIDEINLGEFLTWLKEERWKKEALK